jgi:leucyl-tRNA synthetase
MDKMSKSKNNVVSPQPLKEKYGIDAQRLYILFMGPPEKDAIWQDDGIVGCFRFLNRLYNFSSSLIPKVLNTSYTCEEIDALELPTNFKNLRLKLHQTIKKVTESFQSDFKFNTSISAIMELLNLAEETVSVDSELNEVERKILREFIENLIILIAPFVPYLAEELHEQLGYKESVFTKKWCKYCEKALKITEAEIAVQINGKFRGTISVCIPISKEKLITQIQSHPKLSKFLTSNIKDSIYIENKLINIIL